MDDDGVSRSRSKEGFRRQQRVSLRQRLEHFTWTWFSATMATGSLAVVLYQTPNQFYCLFTIGKIVYILNLVLFISFSVLITLRFIFVPRALLKSFHHPIESFFFGTFWVSIGLILQGANIYGLPSCGPWLIHALEVCFWLYGGLVMLVAVLEYHTLFITERLQISQMVPAWILPIYPLLVAGPLAGLLVSDQPPRAALRIWVGGVMFQGLGWMVATFMYAIWTLRLMSADLPAPSMRPGAYIAVGPTGYTAQAFLTLGRRAPNILPTDFFGATSVATGDVLKIIGSIAGIFLWLLAFWYFCLTTVAIIQGCRQMSFNLTWWAFVFPNAGLTLALIQIGSILESPSINGVTSAMTLLLVIAWLVVGVSHIKAVLKGQILYPGMVRYVAIAAVVEKLTAY
jgi:C4-dicarboxylate transporter/malic acid transport protein